MERSDLKTGTPMSGIEKNTHWTSKWRCPSNIALVKYWGKHDFQKPMNPSLSFVLQNALNYGFYELRQKNMNWPIETVAPLAFDSFNIGISLSF